MFLKWQLTHRVGGASLGLGAEHTENNRLVAPGSGFFDGFISRVASLLYKTREGKAAGQSCSWCSSTRPFPALNKQCGVVLNSLNNTLEAFVFHVTRFCFDMCHKHAIVTVGAEHTIHSGSPLTRESGFSISALTPGSARAIQDPLSGESGGPDCEQVFKYPALKCPEQAMPGRNYSFTALLGVA